jgi:hypothetical protein
VVLTVPVPHGCLGAQNSEMAWTVVRRLGAESPLTINPRVEFEERNESVPHLFSYPSFLGSARDRYSRSSR